MTRLADAAYVAAQYADSARFDAHVDIYRLYDTLGGTAAGVRALDPECRIRSE